MRILVTGAKGQLGSETVAALRAAGEDVVAVGREELDFARPEQVADTVAAYHADWVINCAAYSQVDKAEKEPELAYRVNRDSARAVAEGVSSTGGRMLQVSTDYIFGGDQARPYNEEDAVKPLGVYGQSKWEGEQAVREVLSDAVILRTAWIYGVHGHNFVKTMLRLAAEREVLCVVDDQVGTPSWTMDVCRAMWSLIRADASGVFNFTNEGVASWYDFAQEIVAEAKQLEIPLKTRLVKPIPSEAYPTAAKRPSYSVLNKEKIRAVLNYDIPHWRHSLTSMLKQMRKLQERTPDREKGLKD